MKPRWPAPALLVILAASSWGWALPPAQRIHSGPSTPSPHLPAHPAAPKTPAKPVHPSPAAGAYSAGPPPKPIYFPGHRFDPRRSQHDYRVGMTYYHLRNYAGALSRFRGAFRHDPHNWRALYYCGLASAKLHRRGQEERYWRRFLALFPRNSKARNVRRRLWKLARRRHTPPAAASI